MVELEQVGQLVGVLLVALQPLDELQLALDQGLAAPGEVDEHGVDVGLQRGLLGGQPDGLAVHRVERARHLADLVAGR